MLTEHARPIFVIGPGRSGTSILGWSLGQHSNIIHVPETPWLTALSSYLKVMHKAGNSQRSGHLAEWGIQRAEFYQDIGSAIDTIIRKGFERTFPNRQLEYVEQNLKMNWYWDVSDPKARWVDATPGHTVYSTRFAMLFPMARFINLVREPSAVLRSWLAFPGRSADHADPVELLRFVHRSQRAAHLARAALGSERCRTVVFEDLVANTDAALGALLTWLGEPFEQNCLKPFSKKINSSPPPSGRMLLEYESLAPSPELGEMIGWYTSAQNINWALTDRAEAAEALDAFASHIIL